MQSVHVDIVYCQTPRSCDAIGPLSFGFARFAMMLSRCSRELTWLVCWLALVVPASAHMELFKPLPIRSQYSSQTAEADKDYSYTSPLEKDGSNWPCKVI